MKNPNVTDLDENTFDAYITNPQITLVDFYADWCGPCRMLAPAVDAVANKKFRVAKVNIDQSPSLARRFKINSIPALIFFKDGQVVSSFIGMKDATQLEAEFIRLA